MLNVFLPTATNSNRPRFYARIRTLVMPEGRAASLKTSLDIGTTVS